MGGEGGEGREGGGRGDDGRAGTNRGKVSGGAHDHVAFGKGEISPMATYARAGRGGSGWGLDMGFHLSGESPLGCRPRQRGRASRTEEPRGRMVDLFRPWRTRDRRHLLPFRIIVPEHGAVIADDVTPVVRKLP